MRPNQDDPPRSPIKLVIVCLVSALLAAGCASTHADKSAKSASIPTPPAGKSEVVFMRPGSDGKGIDFAVRDGDRLIGKSLSSTYFAYECDPGHHVFSSSFGNLTILSAELLPDRIYYVNVRGQLRAFGPVWVKMEPLYPDCAAMKWDKLPETLADLKETTVTSAEVEHDLKGIENYKERMKKYENDPQHNERILPEYGQTRPIQPP